MRFDQKKEVHFHVVFHPGEDASALTPEVF